MATLPDLSTANIGYIAFWNAINSGGATSIDPEDALIDPKIIDPYELYDNGWEATFSTGIARNITVRVKKDGWIIAYFDRTNTFGTDQADPSTLQGYIDLAATNNWSDLSGTTSAINNILERAINSVQSNLSNSGSITYNASDVSLYNFEFGSSTATTNLSAVRSISSGTDETLGLDYDSGDTLNQLIIAGVTDNTSISITFEANNIVTSTPTNPRYGVQDFTSVATASGTEYLTTISGNDGDSGKAVAVGIWT